MTQLPWDANGNDPAANARLRQALAESDADRFMHWSWQIAMGHALISQGQAMLARADAQRPVVGYTR